MARLPMDNKTPQMRAFIEASFPGTTKAIKEGKCPLCKQSVGHFKDQLSEKEYLISGMCQACQDKVFSHVVVED